MMAYIYRINFYIDSEKMSELQIGASLERSLGYLKTLLPNQDGFISARAMHTLAGNNPVHLIFESTWETWRDLKKHIDSELEEKKLLTEFRPHVALKDLEATIYDEVD